MYRKYSQICFQIHLGDDDYWTLAVFPLFVVQLRKMNVIPLAILGVKWPFLNNVADSNIAVTPLSLSSFNQHRLDP